MEKPFPSVLEFDSKEIWKEGKYKTRKVPVLMVLLLHPTGRSSGRYPFNRPHKALFSLAPGASAGHTTAGVREVTVIPLEEAGRSF